MAEFWDKEKLVKEVEINDKNKIVIKKVSKSKNEYVDVRKWYLDTKSGEWKPGKGIAVPDDLVDEIADIMMESGGIKL
jgi:hypothetical protein